MESTTITVINKLGLHARAASKLATLAARFSARITVGKDGKSVDGKSIMSLMLLAASQDSQLEICCDGEDASEALAAICELINNRFDEDE